MFFDNLYLFIFLAGGLGACTRNGILSIASKITNYIPLGVIIVNTLATFLSIMFFTLLPLNIASFIVSGFVVALGTLSSLCGDALCMLRNKEIKKFFLYIGLNAFFGLLSAVCANFLCQEFI